MIRKSTAKFYKIIFIIFLFTSLSSHIFAENEEYIITEGHIYPIEVLQRDGVQYYSLQRVADILDARLTYDEEKNSYIYKFENRQAVLAPGKSLISVEGRLEFISQKTIADDDDILVPGEFLLKIIPLIHRQPMQYNAASRAYILGEEADPYNLQVNILSKSNYLRVVIQSKSDIPFKVTKNDDELTVRFTRRVILLPFGEKRFSEDIIESLRFIQEGNATVLKISMRAEPKDIKSYQFKDPFRLVIDFMRDSRSAETNAATPEKREQPYNVEPSWLESSEVKTIVIDPGHGGSNEGAIGPGGLKEKDITLMIADKLKTIIEQNIAGVKVVLTRTADIDLSIQGRTEIANHNKADLFISIHCNGSMNKNARGAEVFILSSEASDDATRVVAEIENQAGEANPDVSAPARIPQSPLTPILWELAQNEYLRESALLAEEMQSELNQLLDTPERGVKQAPFKILTGAIMPAALVEVAFITNPKEENDLRNEVYQTAIAKAIYRSILRFQMLRQQKSTTGYESR